MKKTPPLLSAPAEKNAHAADGVHPDKDNILLLYNDEVNTFGHVIKCLVEICGHSPIQAEQCALLAHSKGKCVVKTGLRKNLLLPYRELLKKGLTAAIICEP